MADAGDSTTLSLRVDGQNLEDGIKLTQERDIERKNASISLFTIVSADDTTKEKPIKVEIVGSDGGILVHKNGKASLLIEKVH